MLIYRHKLHGFNSYVDNISIYMNVHVFFLRNTFTECPMHLYHFDRTFNKWIVNYYQMHHPNDEIECNLFATNGFFFCLCFFFSFTLNVFYKLLLLWTHNYLFISVANITFNNKNRLIDSDIGFNQLLLSSKRKVFIREHTHTHNMRICKWKKPHKQLAILINEEKKTK